MIRPGDNIRESLIVVLLALNAIVAALSVSHPPSMMTRNRPEKQAGRQGMAKEIGIRLVHLTRSR